MLRRGILSYFDHVQNFVNEDKETLKEIIMSHKGTRMVKDGQD